LAFTLHRQTKKVFGLLPKRKEGAAAPQKTQLDHKTGLDDVFPSKKRSAQKREESGPSPCLGAAEGKKRTRSNQRRHPRQGRRKGPPRKKRDFPDLEGKPLGVRRQTFQWKKKGAKTFPKKTECIGGKKKKASAEFWKITRP